MTFYELCSNSRRCLPMIPGPAGQPALRGMVPDLPDIGWREPPSPAVFGGISLVHEAAAISASAAYPSPAPIAAAITARGGQGGSSRDHRPPPPGVLCSIGCSAPSTRRSTTMSGPKCKPARRMNCDSRARIILGRKRNCTSSFRINERQAALTSQNYCDNKIAPVARYQLECGGCCFAGRSKPSWAKHCRSDGL